MTDKSTYYKELYQHIPVSRYILPILGYMFYFGANIFLLILLPLIIIPATLSKTIRGFVFETVYQGFLYLLTRIVLPLVRAYKVVEDSGLPFKSTSPVIYVANHRSRLDGPLILAKVKNTGVIMKASYTRLPVFSTFVKHTDFISVDSSSVETLTIALQRCKEVLKKGKNLLIFPEGSRSRSSRLQTFKELAFRLSIETDTPIVPVIVHTNFPIMAKFKRSLFTPEIMNLTVRALLPIKAQEKERPTDFAERVRKIMVDEIKALDCDTYWEYLGNIKN